MKQKQTRLISVFSISLGLALGAASCSKPAPPPAEAPAEPASSGAPEAPPSEPSAAPPDTPVSSPAASGSAEPSEEIPKNCNFRVKGFCFAEQEEACAASDCPPGKCMVLESHPARIKCAK
jgi:hypothetical protein